ncbi:TRAP transporter substrate-binding protein DctP [Siccirubricoccus phaeus]|uniref:TRAP transporter substrate-binding protein DctP n=1 Tax=Siccirubricoccus phaeus TaxID=2595053 RepID=UPI00165A3B77|nr:TRAP transporter substrate-binding protein DctP [Siccirubricoccus phaeus]
MQSFLGAGTVEWERLVPRFIQRVNQMSGGRIQITPFPPGALVPTFDMLDAVGRRVVDIGYGSQLYWRGRFPFTQWSWGVPFAFRSVEQYDYLWFEGGMTDLVREAFTTVGVQFLGPVYSDDWGSTISRRPIRRLEDFRGMKVRTGGIAGEIWKNFGASIVTIPGEEMYTAMSTGVIDAANWGSPYGMMAAKLHEVGKFYTGPSLIHADAEDMFMNKAAFDALPKDLQDVMTLAVRVYALERYAFAIGESARAFDKLKAAGVEIIVLPPEDVQRIRTMSDELLPRLAGDDDYTKRALKIINDTRTLLAQRPADF